MLLWMRNSRFCIPVCLDLSILHPTVFFDRSVRSKFLSSVESFCALIFYHNNRFLSLAIFEIFSQKNEKLQARLSWAKPALVSFTWTVQNFCTDVRIFFQLFSEIVAEIFNSVDVKVKNNMKIKKFNWFLFVYFVIGT